MQEDVISYALQVQTMYLYRTSYLAIHSLPVLVVSLLLLLPRSRPLFPFPLPLTLTLLRPRPPPSGMPLGIPSL